MTSWVIIRARKNLQGGYRVRSKNPIRGKYKYLSPKPVTIHTAKKLLKRVSLSSFLERKAKRKILLKKYRKKYKLFLAKKEATKR